MEWQAPISRVAGWLANDYYDPEYVPVLDGRSDDGRWQWMKPSADKLPFYYRLPPDSSGTAGVLGISSTMPKRYIYLADWRKGSLLLAIVLALLYGLYKLIRRISKGIFLQKFVAAGSGDRVLPCFDTWCEAEFLDAEERAARGGRDAGGYSERPPALGGGR